MVAGLAARRGLLAVVAVAVALGIWRLAFVIAGVDPDSDAYGHHAIARQILVAPRDLTVHWVWLPLWHYAQALLILLGGTMQTVRFGNVLLATATPIVLFKLLELHRAGREDSRWDPAPAIAGIVAALSPIAMQMGTTGQTEPLFALLVLLVLYALGRDRPGLAAAALGVAVLLRYESWSVVPAVALAIVIGRFGPRVRGLRSLLSPQDVRATAGVRAWLPVIVATLAIFGWAALRKAAHGGQWFAFLHETREFANGALGAKSSFALGFAQVRKDLLYYAVDVPWRVVGYPLLLAPFGIVRTLRREGVRFFVVYLAVLGFVTLTWLLRSSLGLDRHFVVLVPFYATLIGNGIVAIGAFIDDFLRRPMRASVHAFAVSGALRAAVIAGLACAVFANTWSILEVWMRDWTNASRGAWPDRREIAALIADLPSDALIFCDEPTVEILSGVDRHRIDRRQLDDSRAPGWVHAAVARGAKVYVATWAGKLGRLGVHGPILARSPGTSGTAGFVLLRVED